MNMDFKSWKEAEGDLLSRRAFRNRFELWGSCAAWMLKDSQTVSATMRRAELNAVIGGALDRRLDDELLDVVFSDERAVADLNKWVDSQTQFIA